MSSIEEFAVNDFVMTASGKEKLKYNGHKAQIVKILSRTYKVLLLEGPMKDTEKEYAKAQIKPWVVVKVEDPAKSKADMVKEMFGEMVPPASQRFGSGPADPRK